MPLTIDEAIVTRLISQSAITDLVSKDPLPDFYPQNEPLPVITYTLEDDNSIHTQGGPSALRQAIYLICVWSETPSQATEIAILIQAALDGYQGDIGDCESPETYTRICGSLMDNMDREYVPDLEVWCVGMRFTVSYQRIPE